jgi:hypothetical protein
VILEIVFKSKTPELGAELAVVVDVEAVLELVDYSYSTSEINLWTAGSHSPLPRCSEQC